MRTDLNQGFTTQLTERGREPYQVLVFEFPTDVPAEPDKNFVWVSGRELTFQGNVCQAIVESWNEIDDTVDISKYISGDSLASRQATITLLNIGSAPFSDNLKSFVLENITAKLYQGFIGLSDFDAVLIDEFVVQDPIELSQSSTLLSLDLVSKNLYANPHIGTLGSNQEFGGVVIGDSTNVPGTPSGLHPVAVLLNDISATATAIEVDAAIVLFTSSGHIIINNEKIAYTSYSGSIFSGCTRGVDAGLNYSPAFPHRSGTSIYQQGIEYTWDFASQPVDFMGTVYVDGLVYAGEYTQYLLLDPVQIGFPDGPPWVMTDGNIQINVSNQYLDNVSGFWFSADTMNCSGYGFSNQHNIGPGFDGQFMYYNGYADATQNVVSGWCDISADPISELITAWTTLNSASLTVSYIADTPSNDYFYMVLNHDNIQSTNLVILPGQGNGSKTWTLQQTGWWWLAGGAKIDVTYKTYRHPGACANSVGLGVDNAKLSYSYTPKIRDHSTNITCEMSGGVPDNPADTILYVLSKIGVEPSADAASFEVARQWYNTNLYTFDGYIPGKYRTSEVLVSMLLQCRSRLIYNAGKIKLVVRNHIGSGTIEKIFNDSNVRQKSISAVRENVNAIYNNITARYESTVAGGYDKQVTSFDQASIDSYGNHDVVLDFYLIALDAMASDVVDFLLVELKDPHSFITFQAFMEAFPLERDDDVLLFSDFYNMEGGAWCKIAYANRAFASGKLKQINLFNVTAYTSADYLAAGTVIELTEQAAINDSNVDVIVTTQYIITLVESVAVSDIDLTLKSSAINITESIYVVDTGLDVFVNDCAPEGYGTCGYGLNPYGD